MFGYGVNNFRAFTQENVTLGVDATFKAVPNIPAESRWKQLLTIMAIKDKVVSIWKHISTALISYFV